MAAILSDDIQLEDMLESYPPPTSENFQTLITAKREFNELASDIKEKLPAGRGKFFKHQRFTHRFLRAYDDLVLLSETGTGKSCEVLGFTEYTRKQLRKSKTDPTHADEKAAHFKQVYVLVKGPTQKSEFKNQLFCKCSDGSYETDLVKNSKNEKDQKSNVSRAIKQAGYIVKTYKTFASMITKEYPDDASIIAEFSDTIFWIDEAHNLLIDQDFSNPKEKEQTFTQIWRVFHLVHRSKRILSTATPMINDADELGSLMNLILPLNQQFPVNYNFNTATLSDLEPYFRGRISFIRASDTGAVIKEVPDHNGNNGASIVPSGQSLTIDNTTYQSQLVVYASDMSEAQTRSYNAAAVASGKRGQNQLYMAERQASNFIFPDGWWGNGITEEERYAKRAAKAAKAGKPVPILEAQPLVMVDPINVDIQEELEDEFIAEEEMLNPTIQKRAFRRYVEVKGDSYKATPEFRPWLSDINNIRTLSCKYAAICELVKNQPGNCFVYGEYVEGSGAIVLGLCLEGLGFERYDRSDSMFLGASRGTIKPFCSTSLESNVSTRTVKQEVAPKLRYALLGGNMSDAKFVSMMEAINRPENRHGDYIKVLISSRVGRDAINVNNVTQIHLIGSEWNQSAMYQAISRGIRATSDEDLIKEEIERLMARGMTEDDAKLNARVAVNIYKHAAIPNPAVGPAESIDVQMYRQSEIKIRKIKRVMRIMKQCAIGCQVHYNRNVRATDVDYSAACDYDVCRYDCVNPSPESVGVSEDLSTYDVIYSDEVVDAARDKILTIYRQVNALNLETIIATFPQFKRKYLLMALEQLITNKIPILDRFGYTTYLREDRGTFDLDRNYPSDTPASYAMSYYSNGIIAVDQKSLANIVTELESEKTLELRGALSNLNPNDANFLTTLRSMDIAGQAAVLEDTIIQAVKGATGAQIDIILQEYQNFILPMHEPVTELNRLYAEAAITRPKVGRPVKVGADRRPKKINVATLDSATLQQDKDSQMVYIHDIVLQSSWTNAI